MYTQPYQSLVIFSISSYDMEKVHNAFAVVKQSSQKNSYAR
jgi:hypothetical protein